MNCDQPAEKPFVVIMGQTPPPWHGQAVATQLLFDYQWPDFEVHRIRMAFSGEIEQIGRVQLHKLAHTLALWKDIRKITGGRGDGILIYPPASPNWVPILRDFILLPSIRRRFGKVVYIHHAGGLGEWLAASRFRRWIARMAYGRADLSLEVTRENPAPHDVLRARSWAWTPYGVEVPPLPARIRSDNQPTVVLFVGSLQEGKGVLEVLRTAAILRQRGMGQDFRFRIIGRWIAKQFEADARRMLDELQLQGMVDFPGQLTGDEKWRAYSEADVFFFPTHYESEAFPLVLIEALACGLPIVTTRWRGIPDLVGDCEAATLCDIRSPEQFADALQHQRRDAHHSADIARKARAYYEKCYLPEHFLTQIGSLISELSAQTGAAAKISPAIPSSPLTRSGAATRPLLTVSVYLADQNPGYDRSFGISRMSRMVLGSLQGRGNVLLEAVVSKSSQRGPDNLTITRSLPWGTRSKLVRLLSDHLHPLFIRPDSEPDLYYFPKGFLPLLDVFCRPSVVTIHDTIIQYDEDHYPEWRVRWEYGYWAGVLKHTLRHADRIMTVSEFSQRQIAAFMLRHGIPAKEIIVTYEPCAYESVPQPDAPEKVNKVIHLASIEPHKRTAQLIGWWLEAEVEGHNLPDLELIGSVAAGLLDRIEASRTIRLLQFMEDAELQAAYSSARALVLPSEIEGFGLPALEAYYLGTPVCFVKGTSVEEILAGATGKGAFSLESRASFFAALDEVMAMDAAEIRRCGLTLRETFDSAKVSERIEKVFDDLAAQGLSRAPFPNAPVN